MLDRAMILVVVKGADGWKIAAGQLTKQHEGASRNHAMGLTNRWSQPLAAAKSTSDFMKQSFVFAAFAAASSDSAPPR